MQQGYDSQWKEAFFIETTALRHGARFPIAYLLLPQIAAFVFCANAGWCAEISPLRWLFSGVAFLACAITALLAMRSREREENAPGGNVFSVVWKIAFPLAAFFCFCFWWQIRLPPPAHWVDKASREAEFVLRVERAYAGSEKNYGGFARVESVSDPEVFSPLAGTRVWYSFVRKDYPPNVPAPAEGMRFRANGVVRGLGGGNASATGDDSFYDFLRRERVSAIFSRVENPEILSGGEGFFFRKFSAANAYLHAQVAKIAVAPAPPGEGEGISRSGRVLGAMLLGDRSMLLPEQKENFLLTGTFHVFAVSGLHVSILGVGLMALFRVLRVPSVPATAGALGVLWLFVCAVGASPSAMRAWMMLVFVSLGCFVGRGRMAFHGLLFSALVALTLNPALVQNAGFQLSYFVVAAILLYGVPVAQALVRAREARVWVPESEMSFPRRLAERLLRGALGGFGITLAAFLAGAPIVAVTFGVCSFVSLPANVVLFPVVALAAWTGAVALCLACVPVAGTFLGKCAFWVAEFPLVALDRGTEFLAKCPGVVADIAFPWRGLGVAGGALMFAIFFFCATFPLLRSRPLLRFGLPPLVLAVFLLLFSF